MRKLLSSGLFMLLSFLAVAQSNNVPGEFIVQLKGNASAALIERHFQQTHPEWNLHPKRVLSNRFHIWLFEATPGNESRQLVALEKDKFVLLAQYNHHVQLRTTTPNDISFTQQWALNNTGQTGGVAGADIEATAAWDITTGGLTASGDTIVLAMIDGGIQLDHPDLQGNIFINHNEIPGNSIDDDGNGYVDDVSGWDAYENDGVLPVSQHGTHVAGIMVAKGNNNEGISGVNWNAKVLPIAGSSSVEATVVAAYAYAAEMRIQYNESNGQKGAFVVATNSSFGVDNGNPTNYPIWCAFYDTLGAYGILSAGATANANLNVDQVGDIPSTCMSEFFIGVTNTTSADVKYTSAGYGVNSIDIAAPGTTIYSSIINGGYGSLSGTSMATPHVTGAIGLMYAAACELLIENYKTNPAGTALLMRDYLLNGAEQLNSLTNLVANKRRLNLNGALQQVQTYVCDPLAPPSAGFTSPAHAGCPGLTVNYYNQSSSNATSFEWHFPGGTPSASTELHPVVTYNTLGVYAVTLITTNDNGSDTLEIPAYVDVNSSGTRIVFSEDFEADSLQQTGWSIENAGQNSTWELFNIIGTSPGTQAARIPIFDHVDEAGNRDAIISPPFSFVETSANTLYFEYAYRRRSTSITDSLLVYASGDDGQSWQLLLALAEDGFGTFATGGIFPNSFVPTSALNWCTSSTTGPDCFSLDLSAFDGLETIRVKFESYNASGNNIYIDNVRVSGICSNPEVGEPTAAFSLPSTIVCTNSPVQFNNASTNATLYNWSFPGAEPASSSASNPIVSYANPGIYPVQLIASNSAQADTLLQTAWLTVQTSPAVPDIQFDGTLVSTTFGGTYQWYFNGNPILGATNASYQPTQSGNYQIEVFFSSGCSNVASLDVIVNGLNSISSSSSITVFPNPVSDVLTIQLPLQQKAIINLNDASGRLVKKLETKGNIQFSMQDFPSGVYILAVEMEGQTNHYQIIHTSSLSH
ncbi:MAG: hypothetical protein RLZZ543_1315 [Bacteroidota bacterium]|jgi:PKD repeat protein